MNDCPDEPLAAVQAAWNRAAACWDVDAMAQVYTSDAVLFGGRPGLARGRAGARDYYASYIDVITSARLSLVEQVAAEPAPGVHVFQGYGVFDLTLVDGRLSVTRQRSTLCIVRREGRWQILQHHFSSTPEQPPLGDGA